MIHRMSGLQPNGIPRPRRVMRRVWRALAGACLALAVTASPAAAQKIEEESPTDARLEGYPTPVAIEEGGTTMTWALFLVLTLIGCSVLLKNAKRTHLD